MYGTLATLVVALHFAFIVFVVFGGLLTLVWRRSPWLHVPAAIWGGFVALTGRICPLTPLEQQLRRMAGQEPYVGQFLDRYLVGIVYPAGLTREIQIGLGVGAVLINVAIYLEVARRLRRDPTGSATDES